jgi:predicted ATPase
MEFKKRTRIIPEENPDMNSVNSGSGSQSGNFTEKDFRVIVNSSFRKIKKGEVFNFDIPLTVIVGENGSGKSSLLQAIRGKYDKKKDSLNTDEFRKLSKNISLETGCEHFLFFDSIKDNGSDMNNSYDAMSFISNGGFATKNISHGETQMYYLNKLINDIKALRTKTDKKIVLCLDEMDKGYSLKTQSKIITLLLNLIMKYNCRILCITHNYLLIKKAGIVFDFDNRKYILSKDYLKQFEEDVEKE